MPLVHREKEEGTVRLLACCDLYTQVNLVDSALRAFGHGKGDVIALLAIAKIGGVILPLFSGYGPGEVATRLYDAGAQAVVFAAAAGFRRGRKAPMMPNVDSALTRAPSVERVMSPEERLSRRNSRWRSENPVCCEEPAVCPEVTLEEPVEVRWGSVSEVDRAHGQSLMTSLVNPDGDSQSTPESSNSMGMKRYVFSGQVVAMRHGGTLNFLRSDHLGSASLIQDGIGR